MVRRKRNFGDYQNLSGEMLMKGYVELSQENGLKLCVDCLNAMCHYEYKYETRIVSRWFGLVKKEKKCCINTPHWYEYETALKRGINFLMDLLKREDIVLHCCSSLVDMDDKSNS